MSILRVSRNRFLLLLIVIFGVWTRVSGFTGHELWFDDAWVAVPAKAPLGQAIHMVDTTPLFTIGMRQWILWGPDATWWAQMPAFISGLIAIVAIYRLLKYFGASENLSLLAALVIAASPIVVNYSTHLKQYNLDIIFASLILWLAEKWRRAPSRRGVLTLALVSVLALFTSASAIVVVAPVLGVSTLMAWRDKARRPQVASLLTIVGTSFLIEWIIWLSKLSPGLYFGWRRRGYLLDTRTLHGFVFSLETMGSQFFHWMLDLPTGHRPDPDHQITILGLTISAVVMIFMVKLVGGTLWRFLKQPLTAPQPLTVPACVLTLTVVLALVGRSPFGGGRTDEVIYPALLLLITALLTELQPRLRNFSPRVTTGLLALAVAALLFVGLTNRASYPSIELKNPVAQMEAVRQPTDYVVIDPWLSFTWASAGIPPYLISLQKSARSDWSQGFHITGLPPYIFTESYFNPSWVYPYLSNYTSRLWYIAETGSPAWPATSPADRIYVTRNFRTLLGLGWSETGRFFHGDHVKIVEMKFRDPGAAK
jgi:hypothetical protein